MKHEFSEAEVLDMTRNSTTREATEKKENIPSNLAISSRISAKDFARRRSAKANILRKHILDARELTPVPLQGPSWEVFPEISNLSRNRGENKENKNG